VNIVIIIPNWNEADLTKRCLKSLQDQTQKHSVVVVDNGSKDKSVEKIRKDFPDVTVIEKDKNLGFASATNAGVRFASGNGAEFVVFLNNDVVLEKDWLKTLVNVLKRKPKLGACTGKLFFGDGKKIDNTGDEYSVWGLTIPRDRDKQPDEATKKAGDVFGACAGAAIYRTKALEETGLLDKKFFAYYEDTDLNFRLQLAGWKVMYEPKAVGYHDTGSTSGKISGFTTYQTCKNLPVLFGKNMPLRLMHKTLPRFLVAYYSIVFSGLLSPRFWPALKGWLMSILLIPHTVSQRIKIQKNKKVSDRYIWSILYKNLPPNADKLRRLRAIFIRNS
jgi:hypothetical protein